MVVLVSKPDGFVGRAQNDTKGKYSECTTIPVHLWKNNNTKNGKFSFKGQSCSRSVARRLQPLVLVTQFQGVGLFALYFNLVQFLSMPSLKKSYLRALYMSSTSRPRS